MAGTSPQLGPCRPLTAQRGKKQQRAPVAHKAPRPEEQDPRVKCKNCLAFGHKANSVRCPMKHWGGALTPQPLGPKQMKENRKPWSPRDLRAVGPPNSTARETEQRSRVTGNEPGMMMGFSPLEMRNAGTLTHLSCPAGTRSSRDRLWSRGFPGEPPQHSFKDQTETCDYVRHPNRPTLVHTTKSKRVAHSSLSSGPPTRHPYVTSQTTQILAAQSLGQDSNLGIQASGKRAALTLTQTSQNPHKKPRLRPCLWPKEHSQEPEFQFLQTARPPARPPELDLQGNLRSPA
ncbi:protein FAM90A11-like [Saccopteryx bilineata]|uniref:protein FAM90A11-like n=1 Tax=Saccopteryx bilineata TaxID=59482 RepID=UPI00338EF003